MLGFLNPVKAIMGAIGRAIHHTIESITGWAFAQMIDALQSTTAIHLSGWFSGPWRAMASVAVLLALPLLMVGVAHEVIRGLPQTCGVATSMNARTIGPPLFFCWGGVREGHHLPSNHARCIDSRLA